MRITRVNVLTDERLLTAGEFIKVVQTFDQAYHIPYLPNQLSFGTSMVALFLDYDEGKLVVLLTVYADCREVELATLIHPNYRRKGYTKAFWREFDEIRRDYQLRLIIMTKKCFLDKNPDLIRYLGMVLGPDSEYWLTRKWEPYPLEGHTDLAVPEASTVHTEAIVDFQMKALRESKEQALHYVKGTLEDENGKLYTVVKGDTALSSCIIDFNTDYSYFYGFTVVEDCRDQGIGTYFMKRLVSQLIAEGEKVFQITAESANIVVKSLYEELGLKKQTRMFYAKKLTDFTR